MHAQLCPILCDPMDCSPPGPSVHGISQARRLEWVAISFSRGSSQPGIEFTSPESPALQMDSLPTSSQRAGEQLSVSLPWGWVNRGGLGALPRRNPNPCWSTYEVWDLKKAISPFWASVSLSVSESFSKKSKWPSLQWPCHIGQAPQISGPFTWHPVTSCSVTMHVLSRSLVSDTVTLWTVARQAPLSMGFSRQEYWSGLPFSSSGDLPDPGVESTSLVSPALAGGFFITVPPGKPAL